MADNVPITAGTGTTVATDDVSGAHYQRVKLGVGVADSAVMIGHLEDAAHASGDAGIMALAVRKDTAAALAGTDGDYAPLEVDANGCLHVLVNGTVTVGSHAVTNAGTFAVQAVCTNAGTFAVQATVAAGATNIAKAEDVASADADVGVPAMAIQKASPADTAGTDGDYAMLQMSGGRLWVDASGKTLTVGSHAVTNAGTFVVQIDGAALTSLQLIDDAVSGAGFNITQMNGANVTMGNGASGTGVQRVTVANDSTGILAGVTTVTTVTTCSTLTGSSIAHDGADSGNPHKIGAKATTALSGITKVADADRTDLFAGVDGVLITRPHCNLEDIASGVAAITDGSSTSVIATGGANVKYYVTSVIIANSSSSNVTVDIRDGTGGAVKATFPVPANGGVVHSFAVPLGGFTANTALAADPSASATTITVTIVAFKSKV